MNLEKRSAEIIKLESEDEEYKYNGSIVNEPAEYKGKLLIHGTLLLDKQQAIELTRRLAAWAILGTLEIDERIMIHDMTVETEGGIRY